MKIGMMSDSHGDTERTRRATALLCEAGVEFVLHAGDYGGESVLDILSEAFGARGIPVVVVEGNSDRGRLASPGRSPGMGVHLARGPRWRGTLGGLRVVLLHGDDEYAFGRLIQDRACDLVVSGHTHLRDIRVENGVTRINPGALHRTALPGAAWFDTETRKCVFVDVVP